MSEILYHSYNEVKNRKDLPNWFKNYCSHIGNKYKDFEGREVTLIGMSETEDDYYFLTKDAEGREYYNSCVGRLDPI